MAPSPVIPTSFVPKQPVHADGRFKKSGGNIFLLSSIGLLVVSFVIAGGVFGYEQYLSGVRDQKQADVEEAEQAIDAAGVEEFIRTRDRFTAAKTLLNEHVALSQFFFLLEDLTLQNVRFDSFDYELADDRTAIIRLDGVARTFNALAAQSAMLSEEKRIKRAIFSDIAVNENNTVSFSLSAELAPSLLLLTAERAPSTPPVEAEATPAEESELSDTPLP